MKNINIFRTRFENIKIDKIDVMRRELIIVITLYYNEINEFRII